MYRIETIGGLNCILQINSGMLNFAIKTWIMTSLPYHGMYPQISKEFEYNLILFFDSMMQYPINLLIVYDIMETVRIIKVLSLFLYEWKLKSLDSTWTLNGMTRLQFCIYCATSIFACYIHIDEISIFNIRKSSGIIDYIYYFRLIG